MFSCIEDTYNQKQATSNLQRFNSDWNSGHISSLKFMHVLATNHIKMFAASLLFCSMDKRYCQHNRKRIDSISLSKDKMLSLCTSNSMTNTVFCSFHLRVESNLHLSLFCYEKLNQNQ